MQQKFILSSVAFLATATAGAQPPRFALPAGGAAINVIANVPYATPDTMVLRMDVYRPRAVSRAGRPALIFFNRATGPARSEPFYAGWARAAAARGIVAILPDLRDGREAEDFGLLLRHVAEHGGELGLDPNAIAVYAGSGNVSTAFPVVEDPANTLIKAAVMYYGTASIREFRRDLPLLYVRAGLDRPTVNQGIVALAALAIAQNAPVTVLNHPGGYHAFEVANDDDATRDVIEQTLAFVKRTTAPAYQAAIRRGMPEATAAGYVQTGDFGRAATIYGDLLTTRSDNIRLRLSYGEALLGDSQFAPACAEFEKLKGKGLGPRDLGLPAARACMQKGDADAAIAWLKTIPSRFLPAGVREEPVFAPLHSRPDFAALFPTP